MAKPRRGNPVEHWQQLELLLTFPEQRTYELIRPIVLFGQSVHSRAAETGSVERTLQRQAKRFVEQDMRSLFAPNPPPQPDALPDEIRQHILALKAEHPPLRVHELATICDVRFGRRPHAATIKRILDETPPPPRTTRRIPPYHTITEPTERRLAVIRLHSAGWTKQSIAEYLQTSRQTVHETLQRWVEEGIGGLYDKSRAPKQPARKVNLETIAAVRRLQRNPELGAFRIQAALKQLGIEVSLRTCSRLLALNRALYAGLDPDPPETVRQPMPFAAHRRHQYWTVDIRYLDMHQLGGGQIYAITILENYSRAILASAVSRTQDTAAYLMVLYAAIEQHGSPETLISDGGSVFRSTQAQRIYQAVQVHHQRIDPGQNWQSYIEANFNVMRRMTDWHVTRATSWAELVQVHETWVHDFNHQDHWAHRQRQDGRQSPAEVLSWVRGRIWNPAELHRIFYTVRFDRVLDRAG